MLFSSTIVQDTSSTWLSASVAGMTAVLMTT